MRFFCLLIYLLSPTSTVLPSHHRPHVVRRVIQPQEAIKFVESLSQYNLVPKVQGFSAGVEEEEAKTPFEKVSFTNLKTTPPSTTTPRDTEIDSIRKMLDNIKTNNLHSIEKAVKEIQTKIHNTKLATTIKPIPYHILKNYKKLGLQNPETLMKIEKMMSDFDQFVNGTNKSAVSTSSLETDEKPVMRNRGVEEEDEEDLNYDIDGTNLRMTFN